MYNHEHLNEITFFAQTNFRNQQRKFGIKTDDRRRHMYIVGKTGMGKTVMLENMVIQDIRNGHGVAVVDPHGEFAERMLDFVPSNRVNDVIYINPADLDHPIGFNPLEKVDPEFRHLIAAGLMGIFKKIWPDVWSARMEYILNNTILALLEYPGSTLLGINRMLSNKEYRAKVVEKITDPVVKSFWVDEFAKYTARLESEATAAIQNKVGQFISVGVIRNIVGQTKSTFDMRQVMDEGKILIMNISKGRIGEDNSRLLGAMLITKLQLAAMSRVDIPEEERRDFYLYVDEFQNFATESFSHILSEARKYRLSLTLAHQYIAQLVTGTNTSVRDAVFGNVGTILTFRIGAPDAEDLEREFMPEFTQQDLVNLPKYQIYLKLMIEGVASRSFSAETLPPFSLPEESHREKIIRVSQERYGSDRIKIEEKISTWHGALTQRPEKSREMPSPSEPPREGPTLYDARCDDCGKDTKVVFEPDGKRPVYCKNCLKKHRPDTRTGGSSSSPSRGSFPSRPLQQGPVSNFSSEPPVSNASLEDLENQEPVYFSRKSARSQISSGTRERRVPDLEGLRETLRKALPSDTNEKVPTPVFQEIERNLDRERKVEESKNQSGVLEPGESVKF